MTKLAILIGISKYDHLATLSACSNDVNLMQEVIRFAGPFEDTLCLTGDETKSAIFKSKITAFFKKHRDEKKAIEEVFFYYSGHGMTQGENFYFALSDFDSNKIGTTCYSNSELDETIRSLNPSLTIKVIDACQSGQQYIKDAQDFGSVFEKPTKKGLENIYFLFSSASDQSSYCDSQFSHFTRSMVEGIVTHGNEEIRYRDLIDITSDAFRNNINQKPFYITQGNNTEIFGSFGQTAKTKINEALSQPQQKTEKAEPAKDSIVEQLRREAKNYPSAEEIKQAIKSVQSVLFKFPLSTEIQEIFTTEHESRDTIDGNLPISDVAEFVKKNSESALANYSERTITRRVQNTNRLLGLLSIPDPFNTPDEKAYIDKEFKVPYSYEHLIPDLPFTQINITLQSKLPNVPDYAISVVYVITPKILHLFQITSESKSSHLIDNKKTKYFKTKQYSYPWRRLIDRSESPEPLMADFENLVTTQLRLLIEKSSKSPIHTNT